MRVQIIGAGTTHTGVDLQAGDGPHTAGPGPWQPLAVLGAASPGGLQLPPATPSASWLYAPRAVWLDDERVVVADTGNHRVLIWSGQPQASGLPAQVVLGQPDDCSEGPGAGADRMNLPTGVVVSQGRLLVADAWNHRVLVWDSIPQHTGTPADWVIGQPDLQQVDANAGAEPTGASFYWPFGIAVVGDWFYVADTGNRRVLGWRGGLPRDGRPADLVLGQPDATSREENRGATAAADSFRWPHTVTSDGAGGLVVADAGNHRLLHWRSAPDTDRSADTVIGQPDLQSSTEFPYRQHDGRMLRFPYAAVESDGALFVADTANNRVLVWPEVPNDPATHPAYVLGQHSFAGTGENRWETVASDTLCWPYGLAVNGNRVAVADSGNNRVVLWHR